jgi:hypothetical protein
VSPGTAGRFNTTAKEGVGYSPPSLASTQPCIPSAMPLLETPASRGCMVAWPGWGELQPLRQLMPPAPHATEVNKVISRADGAGCMLCVHWCREKPLGASTGQNAYGPRKGLCPSSNSHGSSISCPPWSSSSFHSSWRCQGGGLCPFAGGTAAMQVPLCADGSSSTCSKGWASQASEVTIAGGDFPGLRELLL